MKKIFSSQRFLVIYSGIVTGVFAITVLGGFVRGPKTEKASFDEITVNRINVTEPDGTLRLVISNKERFPGAIYKGKEYPHPFRTKYAGLLFLNDEGTESGGLAFSAMKDKEGKIHGRSALTFDQYMQDEALGLGAIDENGERQTSMTFSDQPDYPMTEALEFLQKNSQLPLAQQEIEKKRYFASKPKPHDRMTLGRNKDRSVGLRLKDTEGRDRIVILVKPDGSPILQFLDEQGKLISQLPQLASH